jgi:stearoyl-CoA desaturase (delta-9 desaturase)
MASVTNPSSGQKISNKQNSSKLPTKRLSEGLVPQSTVIEDEPQVSAAHPHRHVHEDGIIFDDGNSLAKRLVILGTVVIPLLGMAGAIVLAWQFGMMSWLNLVMLIGGWYLTGMGITIGYHRMLTHRSFDAVAPVRWFWTVMGALAVEGSPIDWCMVHRKHHQFSDHHGDPHSPHLHEGGFWNMLKGFWHSHTGWLFNSNWSKSEREKYVPDLVNDPLLASIDRNYVWWVVATLAIPTVIGGVVALFAPVVTLGSVALGAGLGFLWGGLARVCLSHHMTWSINSICHIFGSQDFKSADDSRNNLFFGVLSHGEGWHNNHHAFPTSARHGLKWWQFDLSWVIIRSLQLCGLAWDVKLPTERQLESRAIK